MDVKLTENYGQVRVTDAAGGKPLSKVYVKVYAKLADGSVKFHKDGYTDLRGRFDYASVNTPERQAIERFAVLVLSERRGPSSARPPRRSSDVSSVARQASTTSTRRAGYSLTSRNYLPTRPRSACRTGRTATGSC